MTKKKTLLKITDSAKKQLKELMLLADSGVIGIRIIISKGGCSGYKYEIEYAYDERNFEEKVYAGEVLILISPDALMYLIGAKMDYTDTKLKSGFDFINPNEQGRCGCGESFLL